MLEKRAKLLYTIAYDYYINKLKQKEIGENHKINRVQVSKYLKEAEDMGMVKIQIINPYEDNVHELQEKIKELFNIENAIVITTTSQDYDILLKEVVDKSVEYLNSIFMPTDKIGVGWGKTIFEIAKNYKTDKVYNDIEFIPIMGGKPNFEKEFQSSNICFMLGEMYKGKSYSLLAPYFIPDKKEYNYFIHNADVVETMIKWTSLNKMIIGIGSNFSKTPLIKLYGLPEDDLKRLLSFKHVGDIVAHYYNLKGEFCDLDIYQSLVNIPLHELENKEVIAIAAGIDKKDSIIGALRTQLINTIILDSITAKKIIDEVDNK